MPKVQQTATRRNMILDKPQVLQKLRRMAFEIVEFNLDEKEIVLVGIYDKGFEIAKKLLEEMEGIAKMKLSLVR
ncbi:MAG: phosphoribosyltransferase family protein, partial [Imperialibacter sp.]